MGALNLVAPLATTALVVISCGCGGQYAIAQHVRDHCYENHESWHCPYCQARWGFAYLPGKTQLEQELAAAKAAQARAEGEAARQRSRAAMRDNTIRVMKGHRTRLKKRLANGICPVPGCKRSFHESRLQKHLATVHPTFTQTDIG
jgi:hypothetical protein